MTIVALPIDYDAADAADTEYTAQETRQAFAALIANASSRPNGARSGFTVGRTPALSIAVGPPAVVTVGPFAAILDAAFTQTQAPYLLANDGNLTQTINSADANNGRIDRVCVRVDDNAIDSSGNKGAVVVYVPGTPSATPATPALPARCLSVATVNVPKVGGGNPTVALAGQLTVAAGGVLPTPPASRPTDGLYVGMMVADNDTGLIWARNGNAWGPPHAAPIYGVGGTPGVNVQPGTTEDDAMTVSVPYGGRLQVNVTADVRINTFTSGTPELDVSLLIAGATVAGPFPLQHTTGPGSTGTNRGTAALNGFADVSGAGTVEVRVRVQNATGSLVGLFSKWTGTATLGRAGN